MCTESKKHISGLLKSLSAWGQRILFDAACTQLLGSNAFIFVKKMLLIKTCVHKHILFGRLPLGCNRGFRFLAVFFVCLLLCESDARSLIDIFLEVLMKVVVQYWESIGLPLGRARTLHKCVIAVCILVCMQRSEDLSLIHI